MLLQMSSGPFCVYKGQKQSCNVPSCDKSAVLFTGAGITVSRRDGAAKPALAVLQQITFYFKVGVYVFCLIFWWRSFEGYSFTQFSHP